MVIKRGLIDSPLFLCYNGIIMKNVKRKLPSLIRKVRNRLHHDEIYYTLSTWPIDSIDGVEFLSVTKIKPYDSNIEPKVYKMKKDNMEFIK